MASVLYQSIETLSRDKGIEPEVVVGAVEDAIALATRKYYKTQENMRAEMDRDTGEIRAYVFKTVVETPEQVEDEINQMTLEAARELAPEVEVGGELRFYKDTSPLGRIAAQMAKQVIFQKVREAERDTVFQEYGTRAGEILTALWVEPAAGTTSPKSLSETSQKTGKGEARPNGQTPPTACPVTARTSSGPSMVTLPPKRALAFLLSSRASPRVTTRKWRSCTFSDNALAI